MKKFIIISNEIKDPGLEVAYGIKRYLSKKSCDCEVLKLSDISLKVGNKKRNTSEYFESADICIVLGGDGTMLEAAGILQDISIDLLGINLGTLGYLTEIGRENIQTALDLVLKGDYRTEERMMLEAEIETADGRTSCTTLNDVIIARYGSIKLIALDVKVNNTLLYSYTADGIILSTPTGSTAYNMSVGGPIVEPTAELILMTPIAPHELSSRSIVLSAGDIVEVELKGRRKNTYEEAERSIAEVSLGGSSAVLLKPGDKVVCRKSKSVTRIVRLGSLSFMNTLHKKLDR